MGQKKGVPVVVRVGGVIALVHLSKEAAELRDIKPHDLQHTSLLHQVEEEQGQRVTLSGLSKGEDVKLPAGFCSLQPKTVKQARSRSNREERQHQYSMKTAISMHIDISTAWGRSMP